jgi:hypothetical protein
MLQFVEEIHEGPESSAPIPALPRRKVLPLAPPPSGAAGSKILPS